MANTDKLFEGPKLLLGRASEHIDQLKTEIIAFFKAKPFASIVEDDLETKQHVYKIRLSPIPTKWGVVAKEAIANLRDSLDHVVYASAIALGKQSPEKTGFPFANDALHLKGELGAWKFSDVPAEIHPVLESFKPYPGGNDLLIGLNRVRNTNTHRLIVPVGFATMGASYSLNAGVVVPPAAMGYSRWLPATNEIEYMRLGIGSHMNYQVDATFDVTFGDVEIVKGQPVVGALQAFGREAENIVLAIEAETARILRERAS